MKLKYILKDEHLRFLRAKRRGRIVRGDLPAGWRTKGKVFVVGDASILAVPAGATWSIFHDGRTRRRRIPRSELAAIGKASVGKAKVRAKNPAGTITEALWKAVDLSVRKPCSVAVEGEEDLAGLAVIALAPVGSILIYGIPKKGMCIMGITQTRKARARRLIKG